MALSTTAASAREKLNSLGPEVVTFIRAIEASIRNPETIERLYSKLGAIAELDPISIRLSMPPIADLAARSSDSGTMALITDTLQFNDPAAAQMALFLISSIFGCISDASGKVASPGFERFIIDKIGNKGGDMHSAMVADNILHKLLREKKNLVSSDSPEGSTSLIKNLILAAGEDIGIMPLWLGEERVYSGNCTPPPLFVPANVSFTTFSVQTPLDLLKTHAVSKEIIDMACEALHTYTHPFYARLAAWNLMRIIIVLDDMKCETRDIEKALYPIVFTMYPKKYDSEAAAMSEIWLLANVLKFTKSIQALNAAWEATIKYKNDDGAIRVLAYHITRNISKLSTFDRAIRFFNEIAHASSPELAIAVVITIDSHSLARRV